MLKVPNDPGPPLVVKDYAACSAPVRWILAPLLVAHELAMLERAMGLPGLPRPRGRIDRLALAMDLPHESRLAAGRDYIAPHIFAEVPAEARIGNEEIFGPVLSVLKVKTFDEALEVANGTAFALTGGVYSRKPANLEKARAEFRVGNLYLNRPITGALVGRQPFGGFALSGVGTKAGGPDYLLHFVEPRSICENTMRRGFAPGI